MKIQIRYKEYKRNPPLYKGAYIEIACTPTYWNSSMANTSPLKLSYPLRGVVTDINEKEQAFALDGTYGFDSRFTNYIILENECI